MQFSMIDTHAHLNMEAFDEDRTGVISRALSAGISTIITVGINLESSKRAIEIAEEYPWIYATVGIHPHDTATLTEADIVSLDAMAKHPRVVAIGETGLDFYRNYSPRENQLQALEWQLDLAVKLNLPVIIHCRNAEKEMHSLLLKWTSRYGYDNVPYKGVIHCFNGDIDSARKYLNMSFHLSFGAYIGYPSSKEVHSVIRDIPEDKLLIETDCPFLPPQSHRGKRNEPEYLPLIVGILAQIRRESPESIARKTTENAIELFHLPANNKK